MDIRHKTLSTTAAAFLELLYQENRYCFDLQTAFELLPNTSASSVKKMLGNMVSRGHLMRVKDGLYYVIPFEQNPETFMPDWHLLAQYLVGDAQHYVGYFSALQLLNLTTQPALSEQIVVNRQIKPSVQYIKEIPFQFVYHNEKHFFGFKKVWIDDHNKVLCSDLEKTIIDCLFKPEYAGGITEIGKAIYKAKEQIDFDKIVRYALQFDSQAVIKRLGFLLELLEIRTDAIDQLKQARTNTFVPLEPSYPKTGKTLFKWAILQNIDTQSILSPIYS